MATLNELREQRIGLAREMRGTVDGDWSAQDAERFSKLDGDLVALDRRIEAIERADRASAEATAARGAVVEARVESRGEPGPEEQRQATLAYLRGTTGELSPDLRRWTETRAQSVGTNSAGGFLTNSIMAGQIEAARRKFGGMLELSTVFPTSTGSALLVPTVDDTGNSGAILAENASISETAVTWAQVSIPAYMYTSGLILVSYQLLQDSEFPLDEHLAEIMGTRLGRAQNAHWTTGTGSSQPSGVVTGAAAGVAGATGSTTTITYAKLVDLVHSVDPAWRVNARFMCADSTVGILRQIVDGQSRPLWEPAVQAGAPDMLFGYPLVVNNSVAAMSASAKSILFGDFSRYAIRDVRGVTIARLTERYADSLQVGFYAYQRSGGALLAANSTTYNPVKYYTNSAS